MLTIADEGGGGVRQKLTIADKGGCGSEKFSIYKGILCEQKCGYMEGN